MRKHEVVTEDVFGQNEHRRSLVRTIPTNRFFIVLGIAGIIFLGIFLRVAHLQIFQGGEMRSIAEGNRIREVVIPARRGEVYDRNLLVLAKNIPLEQVSVIPGDFPKKYDDQNALMEKLSALTRVSKDDLLSNAQKILSEHAGSYDPFVLIEKIDHTDALALGQRIEEFPGIRIVQTSIREYSEHEMSAHTIGYNGKITTSEWDSIPHLPVSNGYQKSDFIGKAGLEVANEDALRGSHGRRQIEVDSLGREQKVLAEIAPVAGKDLITSLDARLQKRAYESLLQSIRRVGAKAGSVVAMNPQNGEILALVSIPTYDNNRFIQGLTEKDVSDILTHPDRPLLFRAIAGMYPSGSTIKPLMATAALAAGVIQAKTTIISTGGISIGSSFFPDWKAGGHGVTDVKKAIADSVNTFFYMIGGGYQKFSGLGVGRIESYMKMFGLGSKLGIDLPGEAAGLVPSPSWKRTVKGERWFIGDTYHLSIGQGDLLVTPLQIASMTATVANGGTIFTPHLLRGYLDPRTNRLNEVSSFGSRSLDISSSMIETVREGMRQTVTAGSGRALLSEPFEVSAKTGTAEAPTGNPHGWLTAFAPFVNPEIVVTVMVENGGEGYIAALPVAKDILEEYFQNKKNQSVADANTQKP